MPSKWATIDDLWTLAKRKTEAGVYVFTVGDMVLYVGQSIDMETRCKTHTHVIDGMVDGDVPFCYIRPRDAHGQFLPLTLRWRAERFFGERATLELRLIRRLKPRHEQWKRSPSKPRLPREDT